MAAKKDNDTKKAQRFFKERGILYVTEYSDWKARIQKNYEQQKENEDFSKDFMLDTVQEEIVRLLHLHIGDLPRVRRQIMKLSISGFSGKEIADKLGISVNTVKVQKKRDIENLKKQVEIISIPLGCWRDQTEFLEDIMQVLGDKEQN